MAAKLHSTQEMVMLILGTVFCILLCSQTCTGALIGFSQLKVLEVRLSASRKVMEKQSDNSSSTVDSSSGRNKTTDIAPAPALKGNSTSTSPKKTIATPIKAPTNSTTAVSATSGQSWCVAKSGIADSTLQTALDYACGLGGADCGQVQQGGSCFIPDSVVSHASYAFNSYYQKNGMAPGTCDFAGTAVITTTDPSYASCMYPSSGGMSILNGTVPTGSSTGLSPMAPIADGARSLFINLWLLLPLTSFLLAVIIFSEHL